ncbi:MAG: nucleotidyl transferase AbiEii/AbiGii toxin family protein [Elusimicrobia bacterium]|nr:nucleotidyl transferase AbiEii/AbiGii toxin family protein [Elusimicrobiota bacterium]
MKSLFRAGLELQNFFQRKGWRFCFIGGLALQRWGEPRLTVDVDVSLLTGFGNEGEFVEALLAAYAARIPDPAGFAAKNRVLLLKSGEGIGIDIALAGLPFEEEAVARASPFEFLPGISLITCSAEDLVVLKAFADRPRDWADVQSVIERQRGGFDRRYALSRLEPLCGLKGSPGILDRLKGLFQEPEEKP